MDDTKDTLGGSLLTAYQNAPPAAKEFIDSGKFEQFIEFLRTRMSLPPLVLTSVSNELLLALLAITSPSKFGQRLSEADVPEDMIIDIEEEVIKTVFTPLTTASRAAAKTGEPTPPPVAKPIAAAPTPPPAINRLTPAGPPPLIPKPDAPKPAAPPVIVPPPAPVLLKPPTPPIQIPALSSLSKPVTPTAVSAPVVPAPAKPLVAPVPPSAPMTQAPKQTPPPPSVRKVDPYREPVE